MKQSQDRAGPRRRIAAPLLFACAAIGAGCAGDARVELAAADSIESLATAFDLALQEYHGETESADDARESAVIAAFIERLQRAGDDAAERERHTGQFTAALAKVRADRRVEWDRFNDSRDNVDTLREVTAGLRRLAVESLTLSDEARRYLGGLVEAARRAASPSAIQTGKERTHVQRDR